MERQIIGYAIVFALMAAASLAFAYFRHHHPDRIHFRRREQAKREYHARMAAKQPDYIAE